MIEGITYFIRRLYSLYGTLLFFGLFLILLPFYLIAIYIPRVERLTYFLNQIWARIFLAGLGIPVTAEIRVPLSRDSLYVFCPNHFSYLDIPAMGITRKHFVFVGKSSLTKVPLFGFMYRKLHVTVNRESVRDRFAVLQRISGALDKGKNIVMFPEGGIRSENPPKMASFKDGPFRIAIEKQIPIVPVTIPYNWIILPDDGKFLLKWHRLKVIYHEPIITQGMSLNDVERLKAMTYRTIEEELNKQLNEN